MSAARLVCGRASCDVGVSAGTWNFDHRNQDDYESYRLDSPGMWNWNSGGYLSNDMSVEGPPRSPSTPLYHGGDASFYTFYDEDSCQPPTGTCTGPFL